MNIETNEFEKCVDIVRGIDDLWNQKAQMNYLIDGYFGYSCEYKGLVYLLEFRGNIDNVLKEMSIDDIMNLEGIYEMYLEVFYQNIEEKETLFYYEKKRLSFDFNLN